jgi:hypothetical protein
MAEDTCNGLTVAGEPGYQNYDLIDTAPRLDAIYEADPAVGEEIRSRMEKAHILPIEAVAEKWPEVESRLLQDREKASLASLLPSGHLTPRHSAKRRPQQSVIAQPAGAN